MILKLNESLFDNVSKETISTSDINSERLIDGDLFPEPEKYFGFMFLFRSIFVDSPDPNSVRKLRETPIDLKALYERMYAFFRTWKCFSRQKPLPPCFIGAPEIPRHDGQGTVDILDHPIPEDFTFEWFAGETGNTSMTMNIPVYFSGIRKMSMEKFIPKMEKIFPVIEKTCLSVCPRMDLRVMEIYCNMEGKWAEFCDSGDYDEHMGSLYATMVTDADKHYGNPTKVQFDHHVTRVKGTFLDRARNIGVPLAKREYGLNLDIESDGLTEIDGYTGYGAECRIVVTVGDPKMKEGTLRSETVEKCVIDSVISMLDPEMFAHVDFFIDVYPAKGLVIEKYGPKTEGREGYSNAYQKSIAIERSLTYNEFKATVDGHRCPAEVIIHLKPW